jgi:hypothetical protein
MAFISIIPPRRATGETALVYRALADLTGDAMVARIVQLFSLRPGSMRRMVRSWELAQWAGEEPRATRELLGAIVSRLNDCHY